MADVYRVVVDYTEPGLALRAGQLGRYRAAFDVRADSEREALRAGLDEFFTTARLSSVSWRREVAACFSVRLPPEQVEDAEVVARPPAREEGPPPEVGERRQKPRVA